MILLIAEYATYEANWSSYFYAFFTMAAPVGIIFAYLPFSGSDMDDFFVKETASKDEKAEEPAKEEEPAAEEPAKEEPAEETKEEAADENIDPAIFDENDENK